MNKIIKFPRLSYLRQVGSTAESAAKLEARLFPETSWLFDESGYFRNELNVDSEGFERLYCNNCGHFQFDLHVHYWCRLWKRTQWLMGPGCKYWSHWEYRQ